MIQLTSKIIQAAAPQQFALTKPEVGQGWADLVMDPKCNGGDEFPPGAYHLVDQRLSDMQGIGLVRDGTPTSLFTFDPEIELALGTMLALGMLRPDFPADFFQPVPASAIRRGKAVMVHWCTDRRLQTRTNFAVLGAIMAQHPDTRFLIYARQAVFTKILPPHGWKVRAVGDAPFMALLEFSQRKGRP